RPEVLKHPPYWVTSPQCRIKLNQNESPWDLPPDIKGEIVRRMEQLTWNRYPELIPKAVRSKLAKVLNVNSDCIIVGKGSNEILESIYNVTLDLSEKICTLSPTFSVYGLLAQMRNSAVVTSPLDQNFRVNEEDLLDKCREAKLTVIGNPDSPSGARVSPEMLSKMVQTTDGILVVDEAYVQFSGVTALPLLKQYPNLIITRTYSKAFSLAGFRIGYGVMHPAMAREVQKGLLPYNFDMPSVVAMDVLLENLDFIDRRARKIVAERGRMMEKLNRIEGVKAWPSHANFFLLETPLGGMETFQVLVRRDILVRNVCEYPGCENVVRVTVGMPEENEALCRAIKEIL
ncbi:MAG: histidinol-phosphate transaminase, partial [Fidelibacterota bacterium]